ncbi:MAG: EAL domain-containing response regulator [Actinomycetota bacterium]|nr:EAL domain-containing response regulator [Actinomycetota bacterium]
MRDSVLAQCCILVVDDDEANVLLMKRVLESAGYGRVEGVTDARNVQRTIESLAPDLVLLDMHMPHIGGLSLLRELHEQTPSSEFLPVLVLTADARRETLKEALAAGANDYLTKPVDLDEVLLRVRNLLAIRLSHESLKSSNAALASMLRQRNRSESRQAEHRRDRVSAIRAVAEHGLTMVFQPIVELALEEVVGFEALARFEANASPEAWFAEAESFGLGVELEMAAIEAALDQLDHIGSGLFMAVNLSPAVMLDHRVHELLCSRGQRRLVVELTEHKPVENYEELQAACAKLRGEGLRIAVDDAGAGYSSLHHILKLSPDIIKLDIKLTRDIDRDPVKRALATALVQFAEESHATVSAEGIETMAELETLRALSVPWGQGYHIGRPAPLALRAAPVF